MQLKVGLIGCGGVGAIHAQCWQALGEEVKLVAIADADRARAEKTAAAVGARVYEDGLQLLEQEELDVVDICLPTFLHARYVIKAVEYVKNVIVEKPVCLREEEAQQLLEAQERSGALVQVAHVVRFTDAYVFLKQMVDSGEYGRVVSGRFSRISPRPLWMKGHDEAERTGTMFLDMHIHDVDYVRYLMGEPDGVSAWTVRDEKGIIQHIWSSYSYGDRMLVVEGSWDYPSGFPFHQTFRVKLEKAAVVLDETGLLTVYPQEGGSRIPELGQKQQMDLGINVSDLGPYLNEMKYFVEMIRTGNRHGAAAMSEAIASYRLAMKELEAAGGM